MIPRFYILLTVIFILFVSCEIINEGRNTTCDSDNPLEEIQWLKNIKAQLDSSDDQSQIIKFTYQNKNLFWINPCYQCVDGLVSVYNCQGDVICEFGGIAGLNTCPDFDTIRSDSLMLYNNTDTFPCNSENPLDDIQWLKERKEILEMSTRIAGWQIVRYRYHGDYVFWIDDCYHCPDGLISVYDCSGEVICEFGGIDGRNTCINFKTEATDSTMLIDAVQP